MYLFKFYSFFYVIFPVSFRQNKNLLFAKVLCFRHGFFAKTKIEFLENFREKTKAKTFVPILDGTELFTFRCRETAKNFRIFGVILPVFRCFFTPTNREDFFKTPNMTKNLILSIEKYWVYKLLYLVEIKYAQKPNNIFINIWFTSKNFLIQYCKFYQ
jgi:hypothetical protein